jgi:hypothetical protein
MKYVVQWTSREGMGFDDMKLAQAVFSKWAPSSSSTFHQFVARCDGLGGYAVLETDDAAALYRDAVTFGIWFKFEVHPVIEIMDTVAIGQEVIDTVESVR